tara:strand:- start:49 stop:1635 length:1587 start_codon:yes stop_codon:yes gene_type:complete
MKKEHGEQGSVVAMYHIIGLGSSPGVNPPGSVSAGTERTVTYKSWMAKKMPSPPENPSKAAKFNAMMDAFESFLPKSKADSLYATKTTKTEVISVNAIWVNTWISQALVVKKYLNQKGFGNKAWKYGWFDKDKVGTDNTIKGIPSALVSNSMECIWDDIFKKDKDIKKEFGSQKDSWNPADCYLITATGEKKLHKYCDELYDEFLSVGNVVSLENGDLMKQFVGSVNTKMSNLIKEDHILLPISLKKMTTKVSMSAKENNLHPIPGGKIDHVKGYFKDVPYSYFQVEFRKGVLNFAGNSFLFKAFIKAGTYKAGFQYFENNFKIEQRMQKLSNKQEIKDIRTTDDGELKDADAQAGNVPVSKFKDLIKQWAGVRDYDFNIPPVGTAFSDTQLKYWADEYDSLKDQDLSVKTGGVPVNLGKTSIMGQEMNADAYFQILGQLDQAPEDNPRAIAMIVPGGKAMPKGSFSAKIRNKCYNLRFIRALVNAKKSTKGARGESELCMLLVRLYFLAAKMKLSDKDLQGPFVKLS